MFISWMLTTGFWCGFNFMACRFIAENKIWPAKSLIIGKRIVSQQGEIINMTHCSIF